MFDIQWKINSYDYASDICHKFIIIRMLQINCRDWKKQRRCSAQRLIAIQHNNRTGSYIVYMCATHCVSAYTSYNRALCCVNTLLWGAERKKYFLSKFALIKPWVVLFDINIIWNNNFGGHHSRFCKKEHSTLAVIHPMHGPTSEYVATQYKQTRRKKNAPCAAGLYFSRSLLFSSLFSFYSASSSGAFEAA